MLAAFAHRAGHAVYIVLMAIMVVVHGVLKLTVGQATQLRAHFPFGVVDVLQHRIMHRVATIAL